MDNQVKTVTNKNRIFYAVFTFLFVLGIGITSFIPISKNNVSATSTTFIQTSDYNISLGGMFTAESNYDAEYPYSVLTPIGDNFISIIKTNQLDYSLELNISKAGSDSSIELTTIALNKTTNSQRYKFTSNRAYNLALVYFGFDYAEDYSANTPYIGSISILNTEVNIPIKYATNVDNMFNNLNCCRYLFYKSSSSESKLNIVYANSMTSFDTDPVMSVYLTFSDDFPDDVISRFLYNTQVVRIDRSIYKETEIVYSDPFENLLSTISRGITGFLSIEIFPDFTLGTIISLVLGVSLFTLLLHLIIK